MKKFIVVLALLCNACVSSRVLYTDANGETVYEAQAWSNLTTLGSCYKQANEDCPYGFEVQDKDKQISGGEKYLIYKCKNRAMLGRTGYQNQNYQYYYR